MRAASQTMMADLRALRQQAEVVERNSRTRPSIDATDRVQGRVKTMQNLKHELREARSLHEAARPSISMLEAMVNERDEQISKLKANVSHERMLNACLRKDMDKKAAAHAAAQQELQLRQHALEAAVAEAEVASRRTVAAVRAQTVAAEAAIKAGSAAGDAAARADIVDARAEVERRGLEAEVSSLTQRLAMAEERARAAAESALTETARAVQAEADVTAARAEAAAFRAASASEREDRKQLVVQLNEAKEARAAACMDTERALPMCGRVSLGRLGDLMWLRERNASAPQGAGHPFPPSRTRTPLHHLTALAVP
jgi:DNA repair exonuclease SbcCD ATPase subunit